MIKILLGVIFVFPNSIGPFSNDYLALGLLAARPRDIYDYDLPDEVKMALEERDVEINSEEDLRRFTDEIMKKR